MEVVEKLTSSHKSVGGDVHSSYVTRSVWRPAMNIGLPAWAGRWLTPMEGSPASRPSGAGAG